MTVKRYFKSHLKSNLRPFIYFSVIVFALTAILAHNGQPNSIYLHDTLIESYRSTLYIPVIFICILAYIAPVMELSLFKKRRNLDFCYSLPISRSALAAVHYITGALLVVVPYLVSYLTNLVFMLSRGEGFYNYSVIPVHFFVTLLFGLIMYSLFAFVFDRASTVGDGIWFIILYTFVVALVLTGVNSIVEEALDNRALYREYIFYGMETNGIPWAVIDVFTVLCQRIAELKDYQLSSFFGDNAFLCFFIFWVAVGVASAVGFFLMFGKTRVEKTEDISDSFFGFRTLVPVYAIFGMIWVTNLIDSLITWLIVEILALVGYTVYRRGFRYKRSDIIILAALCLFLLRL